MLQRTGKTRKGSRGVEVLAISLRLVNQDPSNAGCQQNLAVAQNRFGGLLQTQGKLEEAQRAFAKALAISQCLAEQNPSNAGWQRDLAVAQRRIGDVLQAQGKQKEAQAAFGEALAICRHSVEQDPSNVDWQRELALVCWRIAHLEAEAGRHAAALLLYEEASRILGVLTERAPGFARWIKDREDVESELSRCRLSNPGVEREERGNKRNSLNGRYVTQPGERFLLFTDTMGNLRMLRSAWCLN